MIETMTERQVFFISDGTGVTAETFGHAVLTQFESVRFKQTRLPFVNDVAKAHEAVAKINAAVKFNATNPAEDTRPIVFSTLVNVEINAIVKQARALFMDMFQTFVEPLEAELGRKSTHSVGRSHGAANAQEYKDRIEAINFSLLHDDGQSHKNLDEADVILVGVSRSGKTPTSLYLAMQYGVKAANYPLIPEDFERDTLPSGLVPFKHKLFGLTIAPERLSEIRHERRPNSRYADIENCRDEIASAEKMMRRYGVRWLSSTTKSIEEIAAQILTELNLERRVY